MSPARSRLALALGLAVATSALVGCASSADTILVGPRFWVGPGEPDARALRIDAHGRFVAALVQYPSDGHLVFVPGELALPGLADAHVHLAWIARRADALELAGTRSPADVRAALLAYARAHPSAPALTGMGWDLAPLPTAADLPSGDQLATPAILSRLDGHAIWLNAPALAKASGYLAEDHAPPERIVRDAAGHATGVVVDPASALTSLLIPEPSDDDLDRWTARSLAACADAGLVEVHDMAVTRRELDALVRLAAQGGLPARVVVYLSPADDTWAWLDAHAPGPAILGPDLEVRGIKLFADGSLGSRGAALTGDYADAPGERGSETPLPTMRADAVRAAAAGWQVAIHAIGDRANHDALDVLAAAAAAAPPHTFRGRIEHAQVVDPADLARFAALGIVASIQPVHATEDMGFAEARLGPERIRWAYAWKALHDAGVPLALGSDAPVAPFDPRLGLWAATTRTTPDGQPPGGWYPAQVLTFGEAVLAMSAGAIEAAHAGRMRGVSVPGREIALSVFDRDLRTDMLGARPTATVRGLRIRVIAGPGAP